MALKVSIVRALALCAALPWLAALPAQAQGDPSPDLPAAAPAGGPALVSLPGLAVRSVQQVRFRGGLQQTILLRDGGEARDRVTLSLRAGEGGPDAPAMAKPTRPAIMGELALLGPGEGMRVVTRPMRNAYGPIGMAIGRTCLYAWQWIDDVGTALPRTVAGVRASAGQAWPASLRILLCRRDGGDPVALATPVLRLTLADGGAARIARHRPARPRATASAQ
ncbi:cellulose biosynthesis protein BcsN, partial [Methylobacterium crusticola]